MKNNILCFIGGIIFSMITTVCAGIIYKAEDISYNSAADGVTASNVQDALDDIYITNRKSLIKSLNNKGLGLSDNSNYGDIVNGIDSLPFGKTENNEWGYKPDNENTILPFKDNISLLNPDIAVGYSLQGSQTANISTTKRPRYIIHESVEKSSYYTSWLYVIDVNKSVAKVYKQNTANTYQVYDDVWSGVVTNITDSNITIKNRSASGSGSFVKVLVFY